MARRPSFYHHLHPPHFPAREARFRYTFGLGGMAAFLFVILLITGILELFYYVPSLEEANLSLRLLTLRVPYGRLIRSLHFWAAQLMVITATLHLLRVVFSGAYKAPRRFNWLLGLGLLVLLLLLNFTGYALRWDREIAWALMVGTNLVRAIPGVGQPLYGLIVGGPQIGASTVVRFYGWHIYGLTLLMGFGIGWHLFRVRRDGGISRSAQSAASRQTIERDELVRRESLAMLALLIILLVIALLFPPNLAQPANFEALPADATAPWFFIWVQQLLRFGSPLLMGIILPLVMLLLLAALPYLIDRSQQGSGVWFHASGRLARLIVITICILIMSLFLKGAWL